MSTICHNTKGCTVKTELYFFIVCIPLRYAIRYFNGDIGFLFAQQYLPNSGVMSVWGRGEVCTGFWWGSLREGDHWGDPDVDGTIILRGIFRKWEGVVGTGWSGLRIGTGCGHL
jgi:hypothetical protein